MTGIQAMTEGGARVKDEKNDGNEMAQGVFKNYNDGAD